MYERVLRPIYGRLVCVSCSRVERCVVVRGDSSFSFTSLRRSYLELTKVCSGVTRVSAFFYYKAPRRNIRKVHCSCRRTLSIFRGEATSSSKFLCFVPRSRSNSFALGPLICGSVLVFLHRRGSPTLYGCVSRCFGSVVAGGVRVQRA